MYVQFTSCIQGVKFNRENEITIYKNNIKIVVTTITRSTVQSGSPNKAFVKLLGEEIHNETNYSGHKSIASKNGETKLTQ